MSSESKREEVSNILVAAAYDAALLKLQSTLKERNIEVSSKTITQIVKIAMEIVETTKLKGKEQKAIVKHDIVLKDKTMKLVTDEIHYFLESNVASYYTTARITNRENVLISDKGDYISNEIFT